MTDPKTRAIKAAMAVGRDVAEGRLSPTALEAAAVEECRRLVRQVIGPDDALWPLQLEVARGVLAAGGVPGNELAEWLAVQRQAEGDGDSDRPASTEPVERTFGGVGVPETGAAALYAAGFADGHDQAVNDAEAAAEEAVGGAGDAVAMPEEDR